MTGGINIGGTTTETKVMADMAEIVFYDAYLNPTDKNLVESYLAAKYGFPLGGVGGCSPPLVFR